MTKWVTADIVAHFKAGLSMSECARHAGIPLLKVEQAIRRWMVVYPEGKR